MKNLSFYLSKSDNRQSSNISDERNVILALASVLMMMPRISEEVEFEQTVNGKQQQSINNCQETINNDRGQFRIDNSFITIAD